MLYFNETELHTPVQLRFPWMISFSSNSYNSSNTETFATTKSFNLHDTASEVELHSRLIREFDEIQLLTC